MKNIIFVLIGFIVCLSINAISVDADTTDYLSITEERLYEEIDYLQSKVEVSQEVIYTLTDMGKDYPEYVNDILDIYSETDLAEIAYDLDIMLWREDTTRYNITDYDWYE